MRDRLKKSDVDSLGFTSCLTYYSRQRRAGVDGLKREFRRVWRNANLTLSESISKKGGETLWQRKHHQQEMNT